MKRHKAAQEKRCIRNTGTGARNRVERMPRKWVRWVNSWASMAGDLRRASTPRVSSYCAPRAVEGWPRGLLD